jgi:hypothetical protein
MTSTVIDTAASHHAMRCWSGAMRAPTIGSSITRTPLAVVR